MNSELNNNNVSGPFLTRILQSESEINNENVLVDIF